ncbi:MAG: HEAT repeat domain-containing protein, partial [Phycisphaeraceae bacterium]
LENFTSGTRNHLDTAMDSLDNIFTYDNTDDGLGWWTRFTHHVPTGYYGYPYDYLPNPQRHLPRISEHGGGSPVGGSGYREAAWPAKYKDAIFYCEWGKGKVQLFTLKKNGATFDATMEDFLINDGSGEFRPLDLCFSPDGRHMYLADWNYGGWVNPKRAGRVYRITYVGADAPKVPDSPFDKGTDAAAKLSVDQLISTLKHPAHSQRMLAQWELVKRRRDAIAPTVALLKEKEAPTFARIHAAWVLYHLGLSLDSYNPASDLLYALHNGPDDLRAQAARAIGTGKFTGENDRVVKGLVHRAKNDTDASVRMHAAVALGRIGDVAAATELFLSLDDADTFARFAKVQALRAINTWDMAVAYANAAEERVREGTLLALTGVYDVGAIEALVAIVKSNPHEAIRAKAVAALGEVTLKADPYVKGWWGTQPARGRPAREKKHEWEGTDQARKTLFDAMSDDHLAVRLAAIRASPHIRGIIIAIALVDRLRSETDDAVRWEVITALAQRKEHLPSAFDHLALMAVDKDRSIAAREQAIRGTILLKSKLTGAGKLTESTLVSLARWDDTPAEVMARAIEALGALNLPEGLPAIHKRLGHGDAKVRVAAVQAYGAIVTARATPEELPRIRPRVVDEVVGLLKDADGEVKRATLRMLVSLKATEAMPQIIELVRDDSVKREVAAALVAMPDRRALPVLLDYVTDKNGEVRKDASAALVALRDTIIEDLIALHKANELRPEVRRELGSLFASPAPIKEWQLVGAWMKDGAQPQFDYTAAPKLDAPIKVKDREMKWQKVTTNHPDGLVDPSKFVQPGSENWAVAYAVFTTDNAGSFAYALGSDDQAMLFINGVKVAEFLGNRGWAADQNRGTVTLKAGVNHIYLWTGNTGGGWNYSLALGGPDPRLAFLYKDVPPQLDLAAYRDHAGKNKGDASRGKTLFFDVNGVGCVKCHALGKEGTATIGPNLLQIGAKYPREELIRSILEPSNRIVSGYEQTLVETDDGERYSGIVKRETDDELELIDANARGITLKKKAIVSHRKSTLSMMPNGLEKGLSLADFADIVAFLEAQK